MKIIRAQIYQKPVQQHAVYASPIISKLQNEQIASLRNNPYLQNKQTASPYDYSSCITTYFPKHILTAYTC